MVNVVHRYLRRQKRIMYVWGLFLGKIHYILPSPDPWSGVKIAEGLYLGGLKAAYDHKSLQKRGITHVVSCALGIYPIYPDKFQYLNFQARDISEYDISQHFADAIEYIEDAQKSGAVFIHCLQGRSRSASILIAFLMHKNKTSFYDTLDMVQRLKPDVLPNAGFTKQLLNFEEELNVKTVKLDDL